MSSIKAIIGLGNPGHKFVHTRHNIGFCVVDVLAKKYHGSWQTQYNFEKSTIIIHNTSLVLIKPQTYMNNVGEIIPYLKKQGISGENIIVVHDELEKSFGNVSLKQGGSARGHNGLRSMIHFIGENFYRIRIGIGRPEHKEAVAQYVLENFSESTTEIENCVQKAVILIEQHIQNPQ